MTRVHHKEGDDFVDTLIGFSLKHPVPEVAQFAAEILGKIGDKRAVAPLIAILEGTPEPGLAEAATEALGKLKDMSAVPILSRMLERGALVVRIRAADALGELCGDEAVSALESAAETDSNRTVRDAAEKALARISAGGASRLDTRLAQQSL